MKPEVVSSAKNEYLFIFIKNCNKIEMKLLVYIFIIKFSFKNDLISNILSTT